MCCCCYFYDSDCLVEDTAVRKCPSSTAAASISGTRQCRRWPVREQHSTFDSDVLLFYDGEEKSDGLPKRRLKDWDAVFGSSFSQPDRMNMLNECWHWLHLLPQHFSRSNISNILTVSLFNSRRFDTSCIRYGWYRNISNSPCTHSHSVNREWMSNRSTRQKLDSTGQTIVD